MAQFWKFLVQRSDIYATTRAGGMMHFSIHDGEHVHLRQGGKERQVLAPPLPLGSGAWMHALEIRFLLSDNQLRPFKERHRKKAYLIDVPLGYVLTLNLLIAREDIAKGATPAELGAGSLLVWHASLADKRHAVLVARQIPLNDQHRTALNWARDVRVNVASTPDDVSYVELIMIDWSPLGSNVLTVIPRDASTVRVLQPRAAGDDALRSRVVTVTLGSGRLDVVAPDGRRVALVEVEGTRADLRLLTNVSDRVVIGTARLSIVRDGLQLGGQFFTPTMNLKVPIAIDGVPVEDWSFSVGVRFDGRALAATIRTASRGIENRYLATPMPQVSNDEGLVIAAPADPIELAVALHADGAAATPFMCTGTLYHAGAA